MKNKLQQKLLNISNIDPCINLKNKNSLMIDLFNFVSNEEIKRFLWSNQERIELKNSDFKNIRDKLNNFKDADDFIEYCLNQGFDLTKKSTNLLLKNFRENKEKVINEVFKKSVTITKIFKDFYDKALRIQKEENVYPLYIAYGFINGDDTEQKPINAPLMLYEVTIEVKAGTIYLVKVNEEVTPNEKINFYIDFTYGIKVDDDEINHYKDIKIYEKEYRKIVDINFDQHIQKFNDYQTQPLQFYPSVVLALLEPLGGIIKKDVETIINKKEDLFIVNNKIVDNQEIINDVDLKSYKYLEINHPLNLYQKYAIASSLTKNTLIYGPPGTGKSETIASLIANIIYHDKQVLMVSEKMAALDVLEKRLGNLANISLFAFKPEHKDKFYTTLINLDKSLKSNILDKKNQINENLKLIENKYQNLVNYFKKISKITKALVEQDYLDQFIDQVDALDNLIIDKNDHWWFNELFKFWRDKKTLFNSYDELMCIYDLIYDRYDAIEGLEKYHFKASKNEIIEFLNYFNSHQHEAWILKNFVKSKKDYTKAPLIKSGLKNDISILKLFEAIANSDVEEIDFSNLGFLLKKPTKINNKIIYQQLIIYFLILNSFDDNKFNKDIFIQDIINELYETRLKIANLNDALITNQYLYELKNKIQKNPKLIQEVNTVIAYAFLKKRPNINNVIKKHYETLRLIFPIWVLSPIQTCILNPCKKGIFDYGIFDEASQLFLEKAYPLVYRTKISIVAGDDKQLQPTSFFLKNIDDESEENLDISNQGTSLFEQANISMWSKFYLKNHYRSNASELIAFSNKYIYNNELEFDTKNIKIDHPIDVYNVNGTWRFQSNQVEIDKIIDILNQPEYENKTVLVITFNQRQAKVLENEINDLEQSSLCNKKYLNQSLRIRSLENVQGDEADVVILSISFAKDSNNKLRNFFGPLSQHGGLNRLNVAITRAKEKLIVVKSINSNDIKTSDNINNQIFKYFLKYVDDVDVSTLTTPIDITNKLAFIQDVYYQVENIIDNSKYKIKTNYSIGKHQLDIAIINQKTKLVTLGLVLNSLNTYHESLNDFIVAINEQQFISDLKYPIYRISIYEWKTNLTKVLKNIINSL